MKTLIQLGLLALALVLTVGCNANEDAMHKHVTESLAKTQRETYEIEEQVFGNFIDIVRLTQGESAGAQLLGCYQNGYRAHFDYDANGYLAAFGYAHDPMSPRRMAECDSIVKTENRIGSRRVAREKAEEKRKDDAYDKAHVKAAQ